jgi:hypothetical protein
MAKDPWDEDPIVDPWDEDPKAKTYGPVNPHNPDAQNATAHFDAAERQQSWDKEHGRKEDPRVVGGGGFVVDEQGNARKTGPTIQGGAAEQNQFDPEMMSRAVAMGGLNAASLGWGDELYGAAKSGSMSGEAFESERDKARAYLDRAKAASPAGDFIGNVGGGLVGGAAISALAPVTATAAGAGIVGGITGGIQGAGESREKTTRGVLKDAAVGAGLGASTSALMSRLIGGSPGAASDRIDRATAHELGLHAKRGDKGNLSVVAKRYMDETPAQAEAADEIDGLLEEATRDVNAITPGSAPISARDITKKGAERAKIDALRVEKSLAKLARESGLDPLQHKWNGTQLEGAADDLVRARGRRIGEIDSAIQDAVGGVRTRNIDNSLQALKGGYDSDFSDIAMSRIASANKMQDRLRSLYPDDVARDAHGSIIAPRPEFSPEIPVPEFRHIKSNVAKSAFVGNAANNPGIAKEGEQELAAAMNAPLKAHLASAASKSPELAAMVAEYPQLNKEYSFASAVKKAAKYRAEGEGAGQVYSKETFSKSAPLTTRAYDATMDAMVPAAQKRDRMIANLVRMGESESSAKKIISRLAQLGILGAPQATRQELVHAISDGPNQSTESLPVDDSGVNQWTPDNAKPRKGNGADDWTR